MNAIQKFIKAKGPRAFINRTVWRRDSQIQSWMITNKIDFNCNAPKIPEYNKFCTNMKIMNSCSIIQLKTGKNLEETSLYLENIVKYFENHKNIKFEEIIGDFIKDADNVWWLINIKGFKIINSINNSEKYIDYLQDFQNIENGAVLKIFDNFKHFFIIFRHHKKKSIVNLKNANIVKFLFTF